MNGVHATALCLLGLVAASCFAAAPAEAKTYVGSVVNGCGRDVCHGPSVLVYKPRTLNLWVGGEFGIVTVTKLRWRHWGSKRAVGTGYTRVGDPDNGYMSGRSTVRLSTITRAGCSDNAGRFRAYSRANLTVPGGARLNGLLTLGC